MSQPRLHGRIVVLEPVCRDHLELLRNWRNSPDVSRHFIYRDLISSKQQEEWYRNVSESGTGFYWIIMVGERAVGLTDVKNIEWHRKTGESGIFIAIPEYRNLIVPLDSIVTRVDYCFNELPLVRLTGQILAHNSKALALSCLVGFIEVGESNQEIRGERVTVKHVELTKAAYSKRRDELQRIVSTSASGDVSGMSS